MINSPIYKIGRRYLMRHPWQSLLMVLGITLGVAVAVAVDLANASASRAFDLSTEAVAGKATHEISGGPQSLNATVYTQLMRDGLAYPAAPVISEWISSPQLGRQPLQLLGVDPFAEAPFRNYLGGRRGSASADRPSPAAGDLSDFLTRPGAVLLSTGLAGRYGLKPCPAPAAPGPECKLILEFGGRPVAAQVVGLVQPGDDLARRALDGLVLADIATAQEMSGRLGKLDRVELILPEGCESCVKALQERLPAGARLSAVEARNGAVAQMTSAFRVNLTALSLLALVVGLFLIYNTITFSVVQRRPMFGTLRCLGVSRQEIFMLVMSEAFVVGVLGSGLGLLLGLLLGQGAVQLVTQTINDLFFVVTVRGVQVPLDSLVKGALLGIGATLLTAAPPAWEAASVLPRAALSRSGLESKARQAVRLAAFAGLGLLALSGVVLAIPYQPGAATRSLVISFVGTFGVIVGCAMLAPAATRLLMPLAGSGLGRLWGTLGRMASRDVISSLSRTAIAIAALMVAVSVTIGVSVMVGSFRNTVVAWLGQTLQGDIYISAPGLSGAAPAETIDPAVLKEAAGQPGVTGAAVLRSTTVDSTNGPLHIAATDNEQVGVERIFVSVQFPPEQVWAQMQAGGVLVSEPLANRLGLPKRGAALTLYTDDGPRQFPVIGIYYDYASTQGTVLMALPLYRRLWNDPAITAIALRLAAGVQPDALASRLQARLAAEQQRVVIRPNQALRQEVLSVFDRTFAITGALQLLATVVAFIGVLSALLSLELDRQRELGILRSIGLTAGQLWRLILMETGLIGMTAGLLAMPTGYVLALILVYIINRRSFGWTLQMQVLPAPFLQALAVATLAALLAGLYPAYRMGKMITSEALRSE